MRRAFSIAASLYWLFAFAPVSNKIYSGPHNATVDNARSMVTAVALSIAFGLLLMLRRTA